MNANKKIRKRLNGAFCAAVALLFVGSGAYAQDTVFRYDSTQTTAKAQSTTLSGALNGYDSGDIVVITADGTSDGLSLGNGAAQRKAITIRSDQAGMIRTVNFNSNTRLMDFAFGDFYFTDVKLTGGRSENGGIFCRWSGSPDTYSVRIIGDNATFDSNASPLHGGVVVSNPGVFLEGTLTFSNNTATGNGGVIRSFSEDAANGGFVVMSGNNSNMVFVGNTAGGAGNDIWTDKSVTIQDAGTYSFGGGIYTGTLNISDAAVTFGAGSVTNATTGNFNGANLTFALNNNNIVSAGTTDFSAGATQFTVGSAVSTGAPTSLTLDLSAVTQTLTAGQVLLAVKGAATGLVSRVQTSGSTTNFAYLKSCDSSGVTATVHAIEAGKTLYRFDSSGSITASGTDFNALGWVSGSTYVLTGDATISNQTNSNGSTYTIQSATNEVRRITATGTDAGRKRVFDYGYGTFKLSNVEFYGIGLSNDMGCFAQYGTVAAGNTININADNVTFNALKGNYAAVANGSSGIELTGTLTFKDCTAVNSALVQGVVLNSTGANNVGGYVRFSGDGSAATFTNNRSSDSNSKGDIWASYYVTFEDNGTYSLDGGIRTQTLNVLKGADVTLQSGAITSVTTLNIDTDSHLTLVLNDNNFVANLSSTFNSGATQTTIGTTVVTGAGLTPITIDLGGVANFDSGNALLAIKGNATGLTPIIQSTAGSGYLINQKAANSDGLWVGVLKIEEGKTLYRYNASGVFQASGTDFNALGWASGNTYMLTGDATISNQTNSNGSTYTIQSATNEVRRITATGTESGRKRVFDFGYGTYNLSNVEFYDIGLSNDMGCFAQYNSVVAGNTININAHNVTFNALKGSYAAVANGPSGIELTGTLTFKDCTAANSALVQGVVLNSTGSNNIGGYVRFSGNGSSATFTNNRSADSNSKGDIWTSYYVTFEDNGTYSLDGGIRTATLNVLNGADVTLEAGSLSSFSSGINLSGGANLNLSGAMSAGAISIANGSALTFGSGTNPTAGSLTRDASSTFVVAVNDANIVDAGVRTFASGATNVNVTNLSVPTVGTMTSFQVDVSAISAAPASGKEIFVLKNDMSAYTANNGKVLVQTADNDKYLAYLKSADATGLTVGLVAKSGSNTVYRQDAAGNWTSYSDINSAGATDGATIVLTGDTVATSAMSNNSQKTITIQSSSNAMRRIDGSAVTRFLDWGYGTFYLSNVEFYDFGTLTAGSGGAYDMGSVFQNGSGNKIYLYCDNVRVTNNSGQYAALLNSTGGADIRGTLTVTGSRTGLADYGVAIHSASGTVRFYGDESVGAFTNNVKTNGTPNDIKAPTIQFDDNGTYYFDGGLVATTALNVNDGATVTLAGASISSAPVLNLTGSATVAAQDTASLTFASANILDAPTIDASLTVGTAAAGAVTVSALNIGTEQLAGALTVTGAYEQNTDVYLDVFKTADGDFYSDTIHFGDSATFADGANLIARAQGGFGVEDTILLEDWLTADSQAALLSAIDVLDLSGLDASLRWSHDTIQLEDGSWSLQSSGINGNNVPEPSTWALLLLGSFGIGWLYRRKR